MNTVATKNLLAKALIIALTLLTLLATLPGTALGNRLFEPLPDAEQNGFAAARSGLVERQRLARLNVGSLTNALPGPDRSAGQVVFNLFPGLDVAVEALPRQPRASGGASVWRGRIAGQPKSSVTMAVTEGVAAGVLRTQYGHLFEIRFVGNETYAIRQIDTDAYPREHEPIDPPAGSLPARLDAPATGEDGSVIDVMVVYTAKAMINAGGQASIESMVALAESETNEGYANSGVAQRIRVVKSALVTYDESAGFETALSRLTNNGDGVMDEVHAWRDTFKADMVSLWIDNTDYCGIAWVMTSTTSDFSSHAFSVVSVDCATGYYTFAHEMGHNQGSMHDRANSGGSGVYPYSFGYQHRGADVQNGHGVQLPERLPAHQ